MYGIFSRQGSGTKSSKKNKDKNKEGVTRLRLPFGRGKSKAPAEPTDTTSYRVLVLIALFDKTSKRCPRYLNGSNEHEHIVPSVDGKINLSHIVDLESDYVADRKTSKVSYNESWKTLCSKYDPEVYVGFADLTFHLGDRKSPSYKVWKDNCTRQRFKMGWDAYESRSVTATPTQVLEDFLKTALAADNATRAAEQAIQEYSGEWDDSEAFSSSDCTSAIDYLTTLNKRGPNTQPIWSDEKKRLAQRVSITALSEQPGLQAGFRETSQDVAEIQRGKIQRGHRVITVIYSQRWGEVKPTILDDDGSLDESATR